MNSIYHYFRVINLNILYDILDREPNVIYGVFTDSNDEIFNQPIR